MNKVELDKILDDHKLWLKTEGMEGKKADLSYANLRSANLRSANLSYADLSYADLSYANLRSADLRSADLSYANLRSADLDFSCFPLWCGGMNVNIDEKQATQLLYHLVQNVSKSKNISVEYRKKIMLKTIVQKANEFHRVDECGQITLED